jgi:hypothetical protein
MSVVGQFEVRDRSFRKGDFTGTSVARTKLNELEARVADRKLHAEIVKSGRWLYDGLVPTEVWIVKQNFEYHYEEDYPDGPEALNGDGECFGIVYARKGTKISQGPERMSLAEAVSAAEEMTHGLIWDDHLIQSLYGGRRHSRTPVSDDEQDVS